MNVSAIGAETPERLPTGLDQGLDRDAFLRLLLAQLANQDPLEPVKDQAFVAQLAQFSSLERLQEIADSVETLVNLAESPAGPSDSAESNP